MELQQDEIMPCVTPVGYPAKKNALRENMMRKGVRADTRYDLSAIVFEGEAGKPLSEKSRERFGKALEHVRWAPSAVNKQPWRMIVKDETVFFYEKPDRGFVRLKAHKCRQVIYPAYGKGVRRRFGHWQTGDK